MCTLPKISKSYNMLLIGAQRTARLTAGAVRHYRTKIKKGGVMREIDKSKPVLVTGGSGYVASWIIKMLLEDGINVNATVRDPSSSQKVDHLTALAKASSNIDMAKSQ